MLTTIYSHDSLVPESVVVQDELAHTLGCLVVDAFGCQQHVEQFEQGDDGMEPDPFRSQHLYGALLSVHHYDSISDLKHTKKVFNEQFQPMLDDNFDPNAPFWSQYLQSLFGEHFSCLQDAGSTGNCVLDDQTGVSLTKLALYQALGS